jgi:hypothetical protein
MKKLYYSPIVGLIPLAILIGYAVYTVWWGITNSLIFQPQHYAGFALVILIIAGFLKHYKLGILLTGLTITCGLVGLLSLTVGISSSGITIDDITIVRFQPLFLLWAILHFALSGRYYVGIVRQDYWKNFWKNDWVWPGK